MNYILVLSKARERNIDARNWFQNIRFFSKPIKMTNTQYKKHETV